MNEWLLANESAVRLGIFLLTLAIVIVFEMIFPRRKTNMQRLLRWLSNLGLVALNAILLRYLMPGLAIGTAYYAQQQNIGVFNWLDPGSFLNVFIAVLLLDMVIYWQHRIFHMYPVFWRLHRLHHSDIEYDVTTGVRFHPIEIILSFLLKALFILLLGVPVLGVLLFEIILSSAAMFNHGNLNIPPKVDYYLRKIIVTPDMHRVHHSVRTDEMHTNFGFNISIWDKLFGSYKDQPLKSHTDMQIGLKQFRDKKEQNLLGLLRQPFVK